jgi:hypothetical protein
VTRRLVALESSEQVRTLAEELCWLIATALLLATLFVTA